MLYDDSIRNELLAMPKAPVDDVVISIGSQARIICLLGLLFALLAGVCYWLSGIFEPRRVWQGWAIALSVPVLPLLLVGLICLLWEYIQNRTLKQLVQGNYYVHWVIDGDRWQNVLEQAGHAKLTLCWIGGGCVLFLGALISIGLLPDGGFFFGNVFAHVAFFLMISIIGALLVSGLCHYLATVTERLMRRRTPQVVIGPAGVYLTARFAPFQTFGQELIGAAVSEEAPQTLIFRIQVHSQNGAVTHDHPIPFPNGERDRACELVKLLNSQ